MKKLMLIAVAMIAAVNVFARNYKWDTEILYKGTPDAYTEKMCRLDVAYEEGTEGRPVIVWFHGGGLTSGWRHIPETLLRDGAIVVGVGYRFVTEVSLDETIDDAAASVSWVFKNIEKYGGDLSKIYLAGHSAGGYLVSMLGLNREYLGKYGINPDTQINTLVPYSGQVITHFAQRQKQGISNLTPTIDKYAPLYFVRGDAAPMVILELVK